MLSYFLLVMCTVRNFVGRRNLTAWNFVLILVATDPITIFNYPEAYQGFLFALSLACSCIENDESYGCDATQVNTVGSSIPDKKGNGGGGKRI